MRHIRFLIHEIRFFRDVDRAPFRIVAKKKKERKEKKVTSRFVEAPALLQGAQTRGKNCSFDRSDSTRSQMIISPFPSLIINGRGKKFRGKTTVDNHQSPILLTTINTWDPCRTRSHDLRSRPYSCELINELGAPCELCHRDSPR